MDGLSQAKAGLLRMLIDGAPDGVLRKLEQALGDESVRDGPLGSVWALVERESRDRAVRDIVLEPIIGLFQGPLAEWSPVLLSRLWTHLKSAHPVAVTMAAASAQAYDPDEVDPAVYDAVCALAAADLRAQIVEGVAEDHVERLTAALALAPVVRRCLPHLGDWLARMDQERRAAARLAYRDCVALSPDGGPLFFSMMASRLAEPDRILRVISAVMDRPGERYFAGSELAPFGERLLDSVDARLAEVRNFDTAGGEAAGRAAGRAVHRASQAIAELEEAINLSKEGEWGKRLTQQKRSLALAVEGRLKEIENAVGQALPVQALRYSARLIRSAPKLAGDPDLAAIRTALSLLAFAEEVRSSADTGGFGATRARILESIEKHIDPYVEDLLDHLRAPDSENPDRTRAFLEAAADILALAKDEKAGQIVRRRLAAA
jgi:hypothetical protein